MRVLYFYPKGREFKLEVSSDILDNADVFIYERRPGAKIFKWKYCGQKHFFVDKYDTIPQGAKDTLTKYLTEEAAELVTKKKWQEFNEKY